MEWERYCKVVCPWCADGDPLVHDGDDYFHVVKGRRIECEATPIRAAVAEAVAEEREAWQAAVKRSLRDSEITPMAVMGETTPETAEVMLCQAFHELQRAKRPSALVLADLAEEQGKTEVAEWLRTDWWHIRRICAAAGTGGGEAGDE